MDNKYMTRKGSRQKAFMTMINEYSKEYEIHNFIVVEGESDEKFFKKFLDCSVCMVANIGDENNNKEAVIEYINQKNQLNKRGFLGIVDADFDHIKRKDAMPENVIMTDCHDIEMVILSSNPDLNSVYAEIANPLSIKKFEEDSSKLFVDSVIDVAYEIGILKFVCGNRNKYSRPSTKVDYSDLIDKQFNIDMSRLISRVVSGSVGLHISESEIEHAISDEKLEKHDKYQICCGHDVTKILELSFTNDHGLGYGETKNLTTSRIESLLRVAYKYENFKTTDMYKKILEWEDKNKVKILNRNIIPD